MVEVSPSLDREYGSDEWVSFVSSYRQGQKVPPSGGDDRGLRGCIPRRVETMCPW